MGLTATKQRTLGNMLWQEGEVISACQRGGAISLWQRHQSKKCEYVPASQFKHYVPIIYEEHGHLVCRNIWCLLYSTAIPNLIRVECPTNISWFGWKARFFSWNTMLLCCMSTEHVRGRKHAKRTWAASRWQRSQLFAHTNAQNQGFLWPVAVS